MPASTIAVRKVLPVDTTSHVDAATNDGDPAQPNQMVSSSIAPPTSTHLQLSVRGQRCIWCFLFLHQLLNSILLASMAAMYATVERRDTILWTLRSWFLFSQAQRFLTSVHVYVSAGFAFLAAIFAHGALSMLWHSLQQRRLCYAARSSSNSAANKQASHGAAASSPNRLVQIVKKVLAAYGSFGLRGKYFATGFFVRECIESSLQTTQAYSSSRALSNTAVNQTYGVLIFLNCVVCVALSRTFQLTDPAGRLVCVLVDLTLDFAWGTVVPLLIFWPYVTLIWRYQNDASTEMPFNVQFEVEFIAVLSTWDFVLTTFPFMSSAANLRGIKKLLNTATTTAATNPTNAAPAAPRSAPATDKHTQVQTTTINAVVLKRTRAANTTDPMQRPSWANAAHSIMVVYGIAILCVSITSMADHSSPLDVHTCLRRIYPWFSTTLSCVGRVLHCDAAGIDGEETEITNELRWFDAATLSHLEFSGCTGLRVPSSIHRFKELSILSMRHSELVTWSSDASVTDGHFRKLQTIDFNNATLPSLPAAAGLFADPMPESVEWIWITNVSGINTLLEHSIGTKWQHLKYLYCDSCSLATFPDAVAGMHGLLELSLCDNAIDTLDDAHFANLSNLESVWFDGNPLETLPDSVWRMASSLSELSFQHTYVSGVPEWVNEISDASLLMYGFETPLCANESAVAAVEHLTCEDAYT